MGQSARLAELAPPPKGVTECRSQLARGYELHGRIDTAVARFAGCDDVVFRLVSDAGFALVHLT